MRRKLRQGLMMSAPKIKICGLFRDEDVEAVNEAKPDYIGFVFVPSSRRFVTAATARKLRARLSPEIIPVGVFTDNAIPEIASLFKNGVIKIAQLHGNENIDYINDLKSISQCPIIKTIKVIPVEKNLNERIEQFNCADYFLFDGENGGSGKSFDWHLFNTVLCNDKSFLAGGVNLENIADAIACKPYCIDISSGAETNGVKDREKIIELVKAVGGH
jgi:phosphoribosylanthranilate isomerase